MRLLASLLCGLILFSAGFLAACGGNEQAKLPITVTQSRSHNGSTTSDTYTIGGGGSTVDTTDLLTFSTCGLPCGPAP